MSAGVVSEVSTNPFGADELARANSSYSVWRDERLIHPLEPGRRPTPLAESVHQTFRAHVLDQEFPCVGGKSAIINDTYRFGLYTEMNAPGVTAGLAHDLWEYTRERPAFATDYATFVACFAAPFARDEREWETMLWAQLQSLHELDRAHHGWDPSVSSNPEDADFSFSIAGTAFFVIGLHPHSSRHARRFPWPTLVFNAHDQFERLREQNLFDRVRETIRARELKLQGTLNPNLSDYGEHSEARQYSGRAVEKEWRCPFSARPSAAEDM